MRVILRQDDLDFRLDPQDYIDNHEKFIKADLIETAVVQYTHDGNIPNYPEKLIKYMNEAPNWDIQLHGWSHDDYAKLPKWIVREHLLKAKEMSMKLFNKYPTVFYPPWNSVTDETREVVESIGMTVDNESYDISRFIREVKAKEYKGHSVYFHLWNHTEKDQIDSMLECAKSLL